MILRKRFFMFSPDDGAGNGAGTPPADNAEKPVFTQAQLNAQISDRLAKAQLRASDIKAKTLSDLGIDEAGVAEYKKYQADKEAADQKRKEEQGQFQTIIKENQEKHQKELAKRDTESQALQSKYHSTVVKNAVFGLASEMKIHAPDDVFQLVQKFFKVKPDETIEIVGSAGEPLFDDTGKPHTVKSFMASWLESKPWFVSSNGGGSGAGGGKAPGGKGQKFTRSQLQDHKFYIANEAAIKAAMVAGQIVDD
jgi:hypothetical protein